MKANPGDDIVQIGVACHQDDGAVPVKLLGERKEVESAGSGHTDVSQEDVEIAGLKSSQDAVQIVSRTDRSTVELERLGEGVAYERFVVDDQDSGQIRGEWRMGSNWFHSLSWGISARKGTSSINSRCGSVLKREDRAKIMCAASPRKHAMDADNQLR